jgi:TolB-like protein/Flp pilus assembly protein TadD
VGIGILLLAGATWRVWPRHVVTPNAAVAAAARPERSLVVLPFVNMSADTGNVYFSDGLTEEITTRLAGVSELKVISRTSAMHYKGTDLPIRRIAEELGVAQVVEGSVREAGGRLRVTAQLIDARTDAHRWAETFDVEPRDVFQVQERIAREVVRALQVELTERGEQQVARQGTHDPEAYDFYRRGRHFWDMRTREANVKAKAYYQQAIARDSGYADPYAGLALAYLIDYQLHFGDASEAEYFALAKRAAERAVALDDQSSEAHTALAVSHWWHADWAGADRELRRALELNPGNAMGRSWYGLLMAGMGRLDEAVNESRLAAELDPFAVVMRPNYARALYLKRDWNRAIEQYRRAFDFSDDWFGSHTELAVVYALVGRHRDALAEATRATELAPGNSVAIANLAYVHAKAGRTAEAERVLARAKSLPEDPFYVARAYVALGQPDSAFAWLERSPWRWPHRAMRADPALDPIRADPRFIRLSERVDREMGLL